MIQNPIEHPKTELGKRALELYNAAAKEADNEQAAKAVGHEVGEDLRHAREALGAEVARGASEGRDAKREAKLAGALREAELLADAGAQQMRERIAHQQAQAAEREWSGFLHVNLSQLIEDEMADDAIFASGALKAWLTDGEPIRADYSDVRQRVQTLVNAAHGEEPHNGLQGDWRLADEPEPPLPVGARDVEASIELGAVYA